MLLLIQFSFEIFLEHSYHRMFILMFRDSSDYWTEGVTLHVSAFIFAHDVVALGPERLLR